MPKVKVGQLWYDSGDRGKVDRRNFHLKGPELHFYVTDIIMSKDDVSEDMNLCDEMLELLPLVRVRNCSVIRGATLDPPVQGEVAYVSEDTDKPTTVRMKWLTDNCQLRKKKTRIISGSKPDAPRRRMTLGSTGSSISWKGGI